MKSSFIKLTAIFFVIPLLIDAQIYFQENFNEYTSFQNFKILNNSIRERWTDFNAENVNFNNHSGIESWENIKTTQIVAEFGSLTNKNIRFDFRRMPKDSVDLIIESGGIGGVPIEYWWFYNHLTRNEIATWDDPSKTDFKPGEEYWFEYDIRLPTNFDFEDNCQNNDNINYDLVGQWHFNQSSGPTRPPVSLRIHCNKWVLSLNPNNSDESTVNYEIPGGAIELNKWVKWKFNVVFSENPTQGKIKLWKDGVLVYNTSGIKTIFQDQHPIDGTDSRLYFKIGVYKPHWWSRQTSTSDRTYFYDNVKIYKTIGLIDADCDKYLTASDMEITTKIPIEGSPGSPGYHFRIDSNAQGGNPASSNHVYSTNPTIDLKRFSWVLPNTTYFVKVMIDNDPIYYTYPEESCKIYTPDKIHLGLIEQDCGRELTDSNRTITCETVLGDNVMYHFRIDSNATGNSPATSNHIYSPSPTINLANYSWFKPNRTYYVKVRVDNRPMYDEYADEPCEIIWESDLTFEPITKNEMQIPQIFPNPVKGNSLNVQLQKDERIKAVRLFSLKNGEEIFCTTSKNEIKVNSIKFENGVYNLILITNKNKYELKVIKK